MERIEIELGMWEMAPCPIWTDNVDLDSAEKMLYQSAVTEWGEKEVENFLKQDGNGGDWTSKWEKFMSWLCAEEEAIVCECGGIYYEDMSDEEYNAIMEKRG